MERTRLLVRAAASLRSVAAAPHGESRPRARPQRSARQPIIDPVAFLFAGLVATFAVGHATAAGALSDPSAAHAADPVAARSGPAKAGTSPAAIDNPLWAIPVDTLSATRDRPIFSADRRPPAAAVARLAVPEKAVPAPPADPDHPLLTLVGTIVGRFTGIGVFLDQSTQAVIRLRTGQGHDGWVLRAVRGRETSFDKAGLTAIVKLRPPDPPQVARPAVPGSGVPAATATDGEAAERSHQTVAGPPGRRKR